MEHCATLDESPFHAPKSWLRDRRLTDVEHVQKLRRSVQWWKRWRWCVAAFHVLMVVTYCVMATKMLDIARAFAKMTPSEFQTPEVAMGIGIIFGAKIGIWLVFSGFGFGQAVGGFRNENLLLKYYDVANAAGRSTFRDARSGQLSSPRTTEEVNPVAVHDAGNVVV